MARLYRLLLRVFPREFRRRFGDDMTDLFRDRWRDARRRGVLAAAGFAASTIVNTLAHAAAERDGASASRYVGGRMARFIDDLTAAAKAVWRRPAFTASAATMLGVGLGFNIALFAVVNAVVLKPLPYRDEARIMMLWTGRNPDGTGSVNSYADFSDWRARSRSFSELATYNIAMSTLTGAGDPEELGGATVSPEFFTVLGAEPRLGRLLQPGDENVSLDHGRPIVIAHSLWERRFNSDPGILGRSLTLNGKPRVIVGVLSADFSQPEPFWGQTAEFWTPLAVTDQMRTNHAFHYLRVIGRLKPGVTPAAAGAEMDGIGKQLMSEHPVAVTASVVVSPIRNELMGDTRPLLWLFLAAVALVLLLAAGNVVNLLLANASGRRREFVMRTALGANRSRLVSQLLAESTLVGVAGGIVGLAFAKGGIALLLRYAPSAAPGLETTSLSVGVLAFAAALSAVTGFACGAVPAFGVMRLAGAAASSGSRVTGGADVSRHRLWLVGGEVALAVPLLVGAVLLTETLMRVQNVNPGFDASHTLQFRVSLTGARYDSPEKERAFFADMRQRLSAISGVSAVGMVSSLPLGGLNNTGGSVSYTTTSGELKDIGVGNRVVAGRYFESIGIPILQGRGFDDVADEHVVIVNTEAAHAMWGDANPLGQRLRFGAASASSTEPWLTVVGVVGTVRHEALTRTGNPEVFQPLRDNTWSTLMVTMRAVGDPESLSQPARAAVRELDPQLPVVNMSPISAFLDGHLAGPRFGVLCSTIFGALAVALASFGTFAVLSLLVAQRTREIGIRMALGATRQRVAGLVLRESLVPTLAGCVVGGAGATIATRALASQLFGVTPKDPSAFALAIGLLTLAACLASWWPTRRASRVNPVTALRTE